MSLKANCGVLEVSLVSNCLRLALTFKVKKREDYINHVRYSAF